MSSGPGSLHPRREFEMNRSGTRDAHEARFVDPDRQGDIPEREPTVYEHMRATNPALNPEHDEYDAAFDADIGYEELQDRYARGDVHPDEGPMPSRYQYFGGGADHERFYTD